MALTFAQLDAITQNVILKKLSDNIFRSKAFTTRLSQPGKLKLLDGGLKIQAPIIYSKPGSANRFYQDLDTLNTDRTDNMTAAVVEWKQQYEPIRISRAELLKNMGDAAKLNLVASKAQIAQENIDDVMGLGFFSDGTAATGANSALQYDGLRAIISSTSTYGELAPADFSGWAAKELANGGTNRALTLGLIRQMIGQLTEGKIRPTIAISDQSCNDELWSLFQPHQRLMSEGMKKLGFEGILEVDGVPHIVDSHCPANRFMYVNENFLSLYAHREENWRKETLEKLETSNSMLTRYFFMGNLLCTNRRFQGVLSDIETAS